MHPPYCNRGLPQKKNKGRIAKRGRISLLGGRASSSQEPFFLKIGIECKPDEGALQRGSLLSQNDAGTGQGKSKIAAGDKKTEQNGGRTGRRRAGKGQKDIAMAGGGLRAKDYSGERWRIWGAEAGG